MARYSTSYWKYGRQALNDVLNVFDQLRKKREEKEFYDNLLNLYNQTSERQKQISEGFDPKDISYMPGKTEAEPGDYVLGDYIPSFSEKTTTSGEKIRIPSAERYNRAKDTLNEFMEGILPSLLKPSTDEGKLSRINLLGQLLTQRSESLKPPKAETFELGKGESRYIQYPGEPPIKIAEGQEDKEERKNPFVKVGADGYLYQWDFDEKKFVKTNLRAPAKDWKKETNKGGKGSKTITPATSKLIADLLYPQEYATDEYGNVLKFKYDKETGEFERDEQGNPVIDLREGKPMKISEEERKYKKENTLRNIMLQTLGGRTYQFVTNLNNKWGRYLAPDELKKEAEKHYKQGRLSEDELREIKDFLHYYTEDLYKGLEK